MITLRQLKDAYAVTLRRKATPHRMPDFDVIDKLVKGGNPEVLMTMIFLEEHNTGYDGMLERYICRIKDTDIRFMVDLATGLVVTAKDKEPADG